MNSLVFVTGGIASKEKIWVERLKGGRMVGKLVENGGKWCEKVRNGKGGWVGSLSREGV